MSQNVPPRQSSAGAADNVGPPAVRIVTLSSTELEALVRRAVHAALTDFKRDPGSPEAVLGPRAVARLAKVRDQRVYQALKSGALPAIQTADGRYRITRAAAEAWIASLAPYGYVSPPMVRPPH